MKGEKAKRKVFVLFPPAAGHINPVTGIVKELVHHDVDVIFYGTEKYKYMIERTGALYRSYSNFPESEIEQKSLKEMTNTFIKLMLTFIKYAYTTLADLVNDVERDQPDLIIYDNLALYNKYLQLVLERRYATGLSTLKPPRWVEVCPSFVFKDGVYPSQTELSELTQNDSDHWGLFYFLKALILQFMINWKYGISVFNPIKLLFQKRPDNLTLVTVFPQFQPQVEQYDSNHIFIGCCISEDVRNYPVSDARLTKLIQSFEPFNPLESSKNRPLKKRLVYASLGTVFNKNLFVFDAIIEAFKKLPVDAFEMVMSVGCETYETYKQRTDFQVPANVLIQPYVPQIEILKRASLYFTHCGANSTSEAIHYSVPMILLPIFGDQPLIAKRVADDLKLAIRFDPLNLNVQAVYESMCKALYDESYLQKMIEYSKLSRRHNGCVNGCKQLLEILNLDLIKS